MPRPYGGGRGRGRGRGRGSYNNRGDNSNNERQDSGYGGRWGSNNTKDSDDGLSNFPGAKVQNSPGREAFPGGWRVGSMYLEPELHALGSFELCQFSATDLAVKAHKRLDMAELV